MSFATRKCLCSIVFQYLFVFLLSFVDPEISEALTVTDITQTSVTLSWSIGNTQHIDLIQVHQREMDSSGSAAGPWSTLKNTLRNSSHTVTSLTPGTTYKFYVMVHSYGKTDRTNTTTVTTGATTLWLGHILEKFL